MLDILAKQSIKDRLIIGFGFILVLMLVLTNLGIQKVNFIDDTLAVITDENSVKQRFSINFRGSVNDRAIAMRNVALAQMRRSEVEFSQREIQILNSIDDIQMRTLTLIENIIRLKRQGENVTSMVRDGARPAFAEWLRVVNQFIDYQEERNQAATPEARDVAGGFQALMLLFTAVAVAISVLIGIVIEKSLRLSLGGEPYQAVQSLIATSEGDLTTKVSSEHPESILGMLQAMQSRLSRAVSNIVLASEEHNVQTT